MINIKSRRKRKKSQNREIVKFWNKIFLTVVSLNRINLY